MKIKYTPKEERELQELQEAYDNLYAELQGMEEDVQAGRVAPTNRPKHIKEMGALADKVNAKAQRIITIKRRAAAREGN